MPTVTPYNLNLSGATWIDANSQFTVNNMPDRLPDYLAIANSLFNLFNCPIGSRARIFQPDYGSLLYQFLQEPVDDVTSNKIRLCFIQAIARWEPRIVLDMSNTNISADSTLPGYNVNLAYTVILTSQKQSMNFAVVTNG